MRPTLISILLALVALCPSSASVILPGLQATSLADISSRRSYAGVVDDSIFGRRRNSRQVITGTNNGRMAMAIPGYGLTEQIFVGGFGNFLQIYNLVITARVLLSWFPQAQSVGVLQPVFAITDPYLNLFRGLIPPVFGLDLSPILAFFTLNVLTSTTASIGHELPEELKENLKRPRFGRATARGLKVTI